MKYSIGETIGDYGFSFLEKLHIPIFLLHKNGTIKKINSAGRKLLSIAHITSQELESFARNLVTSGVILQQVEYQFYKTRQKKFKLISKKLDSSDYLLVELLR